MKHDIATHAVDRKRWYRDACSAAFGLDLVGERWSLLIMRELLFGPRRFTALRKALGGISANVLTQRLKSLEADGILVRSGAPDSPSVHVYGLTEWGYDIEPVIESLGRWALRHPDHDPELPLSPVSLMMALKIMIVPGRARDADLRIGFEIGEEKFVAHLQGGGLEIGRVEDIEAAATIAGTARIVAAIMVGERSIAAAEQAGRVSVTGNRKSLERFFALFELPEKVER